MSRSALLSLSLASSLILSPSCNRVSQDLEPRLSTVGADRYIQQLSSPFTSPYGTGEWQTEYKIGIGFAKSLDLYRTVTALRRAEILLGDNNPDRSLEIQYEILLCYYLGGRYQEVINAFEKSGLSRVTTDFPPFRDLLIILYDSYQKQEDWDQANRILSLIQNHYPGTCETLSLSSAFLKADLSTLQNFACESVEERPYLTSFLSSYESCRKSPNTAALLNAVLPGTGYFYLGQVQTGITALLINGLFIAASVHFFQKGPIAAAIVTTSFEAGWYLGGIYGGAEQARFYNERTYEQLATPTMNRERLFPVLQLNFAF